MKYFYGPKNKKNYFEGWYFKHTSKDLNIAFIPSISITNNKNKNAFIQVISNNFTEKFVFPYEDFFSSVNTLNIRIKNNIFTSKSLNLNLKSDKYEIKANLTYSPFQTLKSDIMGPFKNFPKMECKHNIFSMKHIVDGTIFINNKEHIFKNEFGYLEGDYGISFPDKYKWIQSNNLHNGSFFLSIATIPYLKFKFTGLIAALIVGSKEYRFATYNCSKILINTKDHIRIKKRKYILDVFIKDSTSLILAAPKNGDMSRKVYESMDAVIEVKLSKKNHVLYHETGYNASIEIG